MVKKSNGFATKYYTENGTIKNPDISNRRRIYLDTAQIYIHPTARRVFKIVFKALIMVLKALIFAIIFGSIGQLVRAEGIANKPRFVTVLEAGFEVGNVRQMLLIKLMVGQQVG